MDLKLKPIFIHLIDAYGSNPDLRSKLWLEIEHHYSQKNRFYHNLNHIRDVYEKLLLVKENVDQWNIMLFALFYHDVIYKSTKADNEEKSAHLAEKRMKELSISSEMIVRTKHHIIATKSHRVSRDSDTNYFTDADLAILGSDEDSYSSYCQNIRKEYSIYPEILYRRGRRKVLKHFLSLERIYKSDVFHQRYEAAALTNMHRELEQLT